MIGEDMYSSSPSPGMMEGSASCDHQRSLGHRCAYRHGRREGGRNGHDRDRYGSSSPGTCTPRDLMNTRHNMDSLTQRMKRLKRPPRNMCSATMATCSQTAATTGRARKPAHSSSIGINAFIHHVIIPYPSLIVFTVLLLHCFNPCTCADTTPVTGGHYPPPFNAAFNKPILLEPPQSTCGYGGQAKDYCKSSTDPSTLTACIPERCDTSCAYNSRLPHHEDAFSRVSSLWGNCVSKTSQQNSPGNVSSEGAVHFLGDLTAGDPCYLTLDQSWMIQIRLKSAWSITVSLWIKPETLGSVR